MPRTTSKRKSTSIRQEQIIEAAQKLILKYGSEHVTIRRIAKEVGISEGAIYRHFKSKSDIFCLLLDNVGENLLGDIEQSIIPEGSIMESLESVLTTEIANIAKRHGMSFQIIAEVISLGDKRLNRQLSDIMSKYLNRVESLLESGVKTGEIRGDIDLEAAAMLFFGMVESLSNYWTLSNYKFSLEDRTRPMWAIFRKAIAAVGEKATVTTNSAAP